MVGVFAVRVNNNQSPRRIEQRKGCEGEDDGVVEMGVAVALLPEKKKLVWLSSAWMRVRKLLVIV